MQLRVKIAKQQAAKEQKLRKKNLTKYIPNAAYAIYRVLQSMSETEPVIVLLMLHCKNPIRPHSLKPQLITCRQSVLNPLKSLPLSEDALLNSSLRFGSPHRLCFA